ncbi:SDR family oxidoreductase [Streptomyces sp. BRA346]|uniref:SDR family oxidoreductase n=1 Tax=Streptomyces sp. BRA346 TaxID=2878199 RepID=UPI004064C5DF
MALLDTVAGAAHPAVIALPVDLAAARTHPHQPVVLRALTRVRHRPRAAAAEELVGTGRGLDGLAGLDEAAQRRLLLADLAGDPESGEDTADFAAEVRLAPDIVATVPAPDIVATENVRTIAEPRHVLLTGATGFLGSFLLRDLLRTTSARIHCLIRGVDEADARARLGAAAPWYQTGDGPLVRVERKE